MPFLGVKEIVEEIVPSGAAILIAMTLLPELLRHVTVLCRWESVKMAGVCGVSWLHEVTLTGHLGRGKDAGCIKKGVNSSRKIHLC